VGEGSAIDGCLSGSKANEATVKGATDINPGSAGARSRTPKPRRLDGPLHS
jgi:hypothetical protein